MNSEVYVPQNVQIFFDVKTINGHDGSGIVKNGTLAGTLLYLPRIESYAKMEEKCAASIALRLCIYIFVLKQQDNLYL